MNKRLTSFLRFWLPFILWAGVIFAFSANPTTRTSEIHWQDFIVKKTAHMVEYFIFSALLFRAFLNSEINFASGGGNTRHSGKQSRVGLDGRIQNLTRIIKDSGPDDAKAMTGRQAGITAEDFKQDGYYTVNRQARMTRINKTLSIIVMTAFLYGLTDEFHQSFTPGREPRIRDVAFDVTGSLLFVYFYKSILPKNEKLLKLAKMVELV